MYLRKLSVAFATLILALAFVMPARAQLQTAINDYEAGNFGSAAVRFYDVLYGDPNPESQMTAEFYLGRSLLRMGLLLPAMYYFSGVLNTGAVHKHFVQAAEEMVRLKEELDDDTFVPHFLNKAYSQDFSQLNEQTIYKINYIVGAYQYRRTQYDSAAQFLGAVGENSIAYPPSQYLLGLIAFRRGQFEEAVSHFDEILKKTEPEALQKLLFAERIERPRKRETLLRLRRLTQMASARTYYGMGNYKKADELYEYIPRFTEQWISMLFERGWTQFQQEDWGKVLGNMLTLLAPHFRDLYMPEAWLLRATAYYYICKFDEAEEAVKAFYARYEPTMKKMEDFIAKNQPVQKYYEIVAGEPAPPEDELAGELPRKVHLFIRRNPRFQRLDSMIKEIDQEKQAVERETVWTGSRLQKDVLGILTLQRDQITKMTGGWVYGRIKDATETLQSFYNSAKLIQFEIAKAQKSALQEGKVAKRDVETGEIIRPDAPRPPVPEGYQYYAFTNEYWLDELGYYEYSVLNECEGE